MSVAVRAHSRGGHQVRAHARRSVDCMALFAPVLEPVSAVVSPDGWCGGSPACEHVDSYPIRRLTVDGPAEVIAHACTDCAATRQGG